MWPFNLGRGLKVDVSGTETPAADTILRTAALLGMTHINREFPGFHGQALVIEEIAMRLVALEKSRKA